LPPETATSTTLELTLSQVAGDPWQGQATVRFQGQVSLPLSVGEGLTTKQRQEVRWYVEEYMDLPEGGNAVLEALKDRPEVTVDFCRPPTLPALVSRLEDAHREGRPYHVLQFDGHGTTIAAEGGIGALCFENEEGRLHRVRATELGDLLARFRIPLVVL